MLKRDRTETGTGDCHGLIAQKNAIGKKYASHRYHGERESLDAQNIRTYIQYQARHKSEQKHRRTSKIGWQHENKQDEDIGHYHTTQTNIVQKRQLEYQQ